MWNNLFIDEDLSDSELNEQDLYALMEELTKCYSDAGCNVVCDLSNWQFNPSFKSIRNKWVILVFDEGHIHEILTNKGSHPVHSLSYNNTQLETGFRNLFKRFKLTEIKPKVNTISERYPSGGVYRLEV